MESREYFLMKDGQGVMDRWPHHHNELLVADAKIFYHGGSIIIGALANFQSRSMFSSQGNSAKVIQMQILYMFVSIFNEHTLQQVLLPGPLNGGTDLTYGGLSLGDNSDNNATINSF